MLFPETIQRVEAVMDTLTGQVIRGYELGRQIGAGGYGAVYRAFQPTISREVAIKVILPQYASLPDFIKRFETEAHLVARLEHPHIVPLYDYWRDDTGAYLVMRWLPNNLRSRLKEGPLPLDHTLRVVEQIASALTVAHAHEVVHRDLKPDNILLDEHGNAYLSDFGIAKDLNTEGTGTKDGAIVGSPAYLSPEQIRGDVITPRADLYSFGLVIYELLTGERPFNSDKLTGLMYKQLHDPLPALRHLRPDLPHMLNEVIQQATFKNPDVRYPDVGALALAFRAACPSWTSHNTPVVEFISDEQAKTRDFGAAGVIYTIAPSNASAQDDVVTVTPAVMAAARGDLKAKFYEKAEMVLAKPRQLIGREDVLARIHLLLDTCDRVLLHGFGGVGKTSLAATIAAERISAGKGAVIWLEAGSESAESLFEALGRTFDRHQEIAGKTGDDRIQAVRELLVEKNALLILDNVWNERALFQMMKAIPPTIPVLITSRHAIAVDGELVEVDTLPPDKALELLAYHARANYANDNSAQTLCEKLGYHPFALEIAGKRIKVEKQMTPARLLENIADAPHMLKVPGSFADIGREGIKDLLDESIHKLSKQKQVLFAGMGGLASPTASVELLAMVVDEAEEKLEAAMNDLQQRGLAEIVYKTDDTPTHYHIHDLTHSYARALFRSQRKDYQTATIEAVNRYVEQHGQDFDLLEFEQPNILGAAGAAYQSNNPAAVISIMKTLTLDGYLNVRGHTPLFLERLNEAVKVCQQAAKTNKGDKEQAEILHHLLSKRGNIYVDRGDLATGLSSYKEALELAPNLNREAILLAVIGLTIFRKGDAGSEEYMERAYEVAKKSQDDGTLSYVLNQRGTKAVLIKDFEAAKGFLTEAVEIAKRLGNAAQLYYALHNLGATQESLGQAQDALATHQEAFKIAEAEENQVWMALASHSIGEDYHALQDGEKAQEYLNKARNLHLKSGAVAKVEEITEFMKQHGYSISAE